MKKVLVIIGTRPEAIKLFPVVLALKKSNFKTFVCISNQHTENIMNLLSFFKINIDFSITSCEEGRSLLDLSAKIFSELPLIFNKSNPDLIIVQGDTTTALIASICAFYSKIKIVHIEAGLRTKNRNEPFPEEINRRLITEIADYHFTPTIKARNNIIDAKDRHYLKNVWIVGNTVIDAIRIIQEKIKEFSCIGPFIEHEKIVLITVHRRENWENLSSICSEISLLAKNNFDISFIFITHPNKQISTQIEQQLDKIENIIICEPLNYIDFICLLNRCMYIITDSGGIQEEAAFFGKFVFILRNDTERSESIENGLSKLVGTNLFAKEILKTNTNIQPSTIYGNGYSANTIATFLESI